MNVQHVTQIIQLIIAPVVMVSACAILVNGLLSRYSAISDRIRKQTYERLELLRTPDDTTLSIHAVTESAFKRERLTEIDEQIPRLLHRYKLVHHASLALYAAICLFVLSMFLIAFAVQPNAGDVATAVLVVFLLGTATMLVGVIFTTVEIRRSRDTVDYEALRVLALGRE